MSVNSRVEGGVEIDGYDIEAVIGHGGMGVVYRALDVRLKRRVALKLMAPDLALDERFRERFARESELAMSLEHPNVIPIHDAGEAGGRLFLAMRHVEGSTLRSILREEGALAPPRALAIAGQVANALDAAHANGLVHRDVKPSNVLLDGSEHVYLADFGLTRRLDEQGGCGGDNRSLGTPAYLAPEQIEGGRVDGRADVYSLGCLLYECLTGQPPFLGGSRLAVVWAHLEQAPPSASERRSELPRGIDDVIRKAMAKEPGNRYSTCAELVDAAAQALGLDPTTAVRRRRPVVAGLAAVLFALAALATTFVATRGDGDAAGSTLTVRRNTLVRIDPRTNELDAVIDVGAQPVAAAVSGRTVWVYNNADRTVSEIDAETNAVRHTTPIRSRASDVTQVSGRLLAADAGGAWVVGFDYDAYTGLLTRVLPGGAGARVYRLEGNPKAVGVGEGAVWVFVTGPPGNAVLRVDPDSGAVMRRSRIASTSVAGGLDVGEGAVWAMDFSSATLYRIDARSGAVRTRDFGEVAAPPVVGFGSIWICAANPGSSMLRIDPETFRTSLAIHSIPAEDGRFAAGFGSLWRHDIPSGNVMRFSPETGRLSRTIRVTPAPPTPEGGGMEPSAIAAGAGGVWVTVT